MGKTCFIWLSAVVFLSLSQLPALGEEFCVDPGGGGDYSSLQDALDAADANTQDDTIQVVQGTYSGTFVYNSNKGYDLTIEGGYTSGCNCRTLDPTNTILDGEGTNRVLFLRDTGGGALTMDGLTIKNGGGVPGGGVFIDTQASSGTAGNVIITNNIVTGNSGGAGISSQSKMEDPGKSGNLTLLNNIVTGNKSNSAGGGIRAQTISYDGGTGSISLTNNTVHGNVAQDENGGGVYIYVLGTSSDGVFVNNNIIRDNSASMPGHDIYLNKGPGNAFAYNNNFHNKAGDLWDDSDNNIDEDPCFRSPGYWADANTWVGGDYHILPGSPCIDRGFNSAPSLPDFDFEGDARKIDGNNDGIETVDIGADEYTVSAMPWMPLLLLD